MDAYNCTVEKGEKDHTSLLISWRNQRRRCFSKRSIARRATCTISGHKSGAIIRNHTQSGSNQVAIRRNQGRYTVTSSMPVCRALCRLRVAFRCFICGPGPHRARTGGLCFVCSCFGRPHPQQREEPRCLTVDQRAAHTCLNLLHVHNMYKGPVK